MAGYNILILNGPNLGALGKRQPEIYGKNTMDILPELVQQVLGENYQSVSLEFYQNNSEGKLIDRIEQAKEEGIDGIVFNAGAYTHTSLALADCLAWIELPVVEVHLSNVLARSEPMRQKSFIGRHVIGVIAGFGMMSYALAVQSLFQHLKD
ncbi:type II 3-dehydroquinate dehydratase [Halodesulfovibrio sp. MK-HDV]|jgi:3-dehydroquinate dehydratase II|uniref:type II 3-dehydroquinate dehydratase n=1 Tax=Halodesulfovibrio sp. MK-HDV TaxID=2599925 RepID=UPI00137064F2|nr:type II 3-dehydroquinate dehydratase [Halodesulfovibrio sp. MK-HDV]KAF1077798.1 3-dehydroquinate dehydratase [Halodesulfovibrio sp. MK-HDV]